MMTLEDSLVAARFAALAPNPRAGDWEDILARAGRARKPRRRFAGSLQSRRRRHLIVVAAVVLVVVVGAASALAVRAVLDRGIIGLAPVGAAPSTPKSGELVLDFTFGHTFGDNGRFTVHVYADGRLITERLADFSHADVYSTDYSTGNLEQRLTPQGVELVKREVIATGLVDGDDLHLWSGQGLYFGWIDFRDGNRLDHVTWADISDHLDDHDEAREMPTPEQASALIRLDARLADLASWLPASAWEDSEVRPYVPSGYSVCFYGSQGVGLSQLLALFPSAAEEMLRLHGIRREQAPAFAYWCSDLTNEEARALARILDDAGLEGYEDVFGLTYGVREREPVGAKEFALTFGPRSPHDDEGGAR
jgi:hypothetical protein